MEDLIKRIEAADGPDRELDEDIALSLGIVMKRLKRGEWEYPDGTSNGLAPYTSSIDAAMTLVEGSVILEICVGGSIAEIQGWCSRAHATTPALALCAAALRARNG